MVTKPIIHCNGTSPKVLLEHLEAAYTSLYSAYEAIRQTAPNGRDYYLCPGSLDSAASEHRERLRKIDSVKDEIEEIIWHVAEHNSSQS